MTVRLTIKSTRSKFFIRQVQDAINRRALRNVEQAAEELLKDTVHNITQASSPPASLPGEYPHRASGDLAASGRVNVDKEVDGIFARISFETDYAGYVEKLRPFLSRTAEQGHEHYVRVLLRRIFDKVRNWM